MRVYTRSCVCDNERGCVFAQDKAAVRVVCVSVRVLVCVCVRYTHTHWGCDGGLCDGDHAPVSNTPHLDVLLLETIHELTHTRTHARTRKRDTQTHVTCT